MSEYGNFKVHTHVSRPVITIKRMSFMNGDIKAWLDNLSEDNFEADKGMDGQLEKVEELGGINENLNLLNYNFSRDIQGYCGQFQFQVKENYLDNNSKSILDIIKPLDIIYIYENKLEPSFIGFVETISFGATAGAYNKIVNVSGSSIGKLFQLITFSTDATAMSFFVEDAGNITIKDKLFKLQKTENNKLKGINIKDAFETIYKTLWEYSINKKYKKITTAGLFVFAQKLFNKDFINGSLDDKDDDYNVFFNYPITANFFNNNCSNLINFFTSLLPSEVYELYDYMIDGIPKIKIRERPFDLDKWFKLPITTIDASLLTDYTFTKTNTQVFTSFFSMLSGSSLSREQYITINSKPQGRDCFEIDSGKTALYGYKPLIVDFVGYAKTDIKNEDTTLKELFNKLSKKLKDWYSNLDEMYCGDITLLNIFENNEHIPKIGERINFCGGQFYITSEKHSWKYGDTPTINYQIERGGEYSVKNGFQPLKNISIKYAELLKHE